MQEPSRQYVKTYRFDSTRDASAWETVQRLADEADWVLEVDDDAVERLRASRAPMAASRARVTRREFVDAVCCASDVAPASVRTI